MYSIVLMMALSGGAESADFGHKCKCTSSCTAPVAASCSCSGKKKLFGGGLFHKNKCHGCTAAPAPCCAPVPACAGGAPAPAKDMPKEMIPTPPAKTMVPTPATNVAADAPLSVDGMAITSTYEVRTFARPALVTGRLFSR